MSDDVEQIDLLSERANEKIEMITSKADEDDLGAVLSLLDDLEDIADEAEDMLSTVDLIGLVDVIDWENLPDAVELEDLPDAIEDDDLSEVVSLRKLIEVTDLPKLWENVDTRALWREKREFDEEMADLTGETDGGDDGLGDVSVPNVESHDIDPESIENAIQSQISDAVGEFREMLLDAHVRLDELRQWNKERFPDRRRNHSRNPTAVSTLPRGSLPIGSGTRYSTVPQETRYSTAPNRKRIYGIRFDAARGDSDG